jgi:hypothetical protein
MHSTALASGFQIENVDLNSVHFEAVIRLYATSKARLGPFPRGAFEDHARRKLILAAVSSDGELVGYLLYRVARNRAAIVHLTTSNGFRKMGIARLLMDCLKSRTSHLLGISLRCRRDYNINAMWQNFGFTVRHSKEGRGADGALLDYWWFDHNHDDLFSQAAARNDSADVVLTAMDANVFFDLTCDDRPHAEDTRVLQADWLQDSVVLCVTPEIYNEIHRSANEAEKTRRRTAAQNFRELKTDATRVQALEAELDHLFDGATSDRDISDMRQVAHAIAAEVPFLVTRDGPMLSRSAAIFEKYGLRILHPTDLVNRFDILRREAEYRPARLEGSNWRERLAVAEDIAAIVSTFKHPTRERLGQFEQRVRHFLTNPNDWVTSLITEANKPAAVFVVRSKATGMRVEIPFLRHGDHPLAGTLLRHIAYEIAKENSGSKHSVIVINDPELSDESKAALAEVGFLADGDAWWKVSISGLVTRDEVVAEIRNGNIPSSLKERLAGAVFLPSDQSDAAAAARLEALFTPAKLIPSVLPCFIVSIRPGWAQHFFDIPVGGQTLMDLKEALHLGIEGAYYCSAHNSHVTAPARVLWYVSGKGQMCVKACSHLEERITGKPKDLYARFRHLGVYEWKHVLEAAGGNPDDLLMAFKFSRTERFRQPVGLTELQEMNIPLPQNPRRITGEQFCAIYKRGLCV